MQCKSSILHIAQPYINLKLVLIEMLLISLAICLACPLQEPTHLLLWNWDVDILLAEWLDLLKDVMRTQRCIVCVRTQVFHTHVNSHFTPEIRKFEWDRNSQKEVISNKTSRVTYVSFKKLQELSVHNNGINLSYYQLSHMNCMKDTMSVTITETPHIIITSFPYKSVRQVLDSFHSALVSAQVSTSCTVCHNAHIC